MSEGSVLFTAAASLVTGLPTGSLTEVSYLTAKEVVKT